MRIRVKVRRLPFNGKTYSAEEDIVKSHFKVRLCDCRTKNRKKYKTSRMNLTPEYLYRLYLKQNKRCIYTGIKMIALTRRTREANKLSHNWFQVSIDRINPHKPYMKGNVQLVCYIINRMKTDLMNEDFFNFGSMLHRRRKSYSRDLRAVKSIK